MATKRVASQSKFSPEDVKRHKKNVRDEVEKQRKANKNEHFYGISDEELDKKLSSVESPFISFFSFGSAPPGGTINMSAGVYNPDPITYGFLFIHGFSGSGCPVPATDIGSYLLNVDDRFNRVTQPAWTGLSVAPSTSSPGQNFTLKIPATIEKGRYIWNFALLYLPPILVGKVFDRATFVFTVT
jgi:hypothetical protein